MQVIMKYMIFWYKMRSLGETVKETPQPSLRGETPDLETASISLSVILVLVITGVC